MTKGVSWQRQAIQKRLERLGFRFSAGKKQGGWVYHDWTDGLGNKRQLAVGFSQLTQVKEFADWLESQVLQTKAPKAEKRAKGGRLGDLFKRMAKEDKGKDGPV